MGRIRNSDNPTFQRKKNLQDWWADLHRCYQYGRDPFDCTCTDYIPVPFYSVKNVTNNKKNVIVDRALHYAMKIMFFFNFEEKG